MKPLDGRPIVHVVIRRCSLLVVLLPPSTHSASGLSLKKPVDEVAETLLSLRILCSGSMASVGADAVDVVGDEVAEVALVAVGEGGGLA